MAGRQTLELHRVPFDERARADLERIRSDTAAETGAYAAGCEAGQMQCLSVVIDGTRRGTAIASFLDEGEVVLVVNAAAVDLIDGRDMTAELFAVFDAWGRASGADKLRFWTARRGLVAKTESMGFSALYVMERSIHVGR